MPEGILYVLKMLLVVALVFLGLCALAVALLIIGAVVVAVRTGRKPRGKVQKEDKDELPSENLVDEIEKGEDTV